MIWIAARPVIDQVGGLPRGQVGAEAAEVLALTALLMLLSVGIVRGWRWLFWGPAWYVVLTAIVGMIQFVIALTMAAGYRRS